MTTVVVSGAVANKLGNGGAVWTRLNWVLGFRKLGFDVFFVEQIAKSTCTDGRGGGAEFEESVNLAYFKEIMERFGLADSAALIYNEGEQIHGCAASELSDLAADADLLVNITGHLSWEPLFRRFRCKAYVDLDPGYTQFWHAANVPGLRLSDHDFYFTVGENVGTPLCAIPTGDIHWRPVRQPVVLEEWPVSGGGDHDKFTTIASWRGAYGRVGFGGRSYGQKAHEFRKFVEVPRRVAKTFEIALDIHPAEAGDLDLLRAHGWRLIDPATVAADPEAFRVYVEESGAEFSVAQGVYVETASGWFSDRTTRYLASGKPALVQDTGFRREYLDGGGLLAFSTPDEAVAGAETIARNYEQHCAAARRVAEEYFDSDKVLRGLTAEVGVVA